MKEEEAEEEEEEEKYRLRRTCHKMCNYIQLLQTVAIV